MTIYHEKIIPGMLLHFLKEYPTTLWLYADQLLHPHPSPKWHIGQKDVLLLQGVNCPWNFLRKIGDHLSEQGYRVHVVEELGLNTLPIDQCAEIIKNYIVSHHLKSVVIITHSKSSLTAKYLLDFYPDISSKITKIMALAGPFNGSILGSLGGNLKELRADSQVLKKLRNVSKNNHKIISIYPRIDNHVIPNKSSILEGAKNIRQPISGHTNILVDQPTIELIGKLVTN